MACGCAKKKLASTPKKVVKPTKQNSTPVSTSGTTRKRRLLRRPVR